MLYLGLISGTSMDAVDAAILEIKTNKINLIDFEEYELSSELKSSIRKINKQSSVSDVMRTDVILGREFAKAALALLDKTNLKADAITAIGSHGQTVLHAVEEELPYSLQIADPNIIASVTGITTISDFRRMDIALGGQGAPLAPLFHQQIFASAIPCLVLNIGGISNITILQNTVRIMGFDSGPGNGLMDDWIKHNKNVDYDRNGDWAKSGKVNNTLLTAFLDDVYFKLPSPKSTGRDYFNLDWLMTKITETGLKISSEDIQATLLELTITSIKDAATPFGTLAKTIIICGGGVHNTFLISQLRQSLLHSNIISSETLGAPPEAVEAMCFAWLAHQRVSMNTLNTISLTGSHQNSYLGAIYLGKNQLT